MNPYCVTGCFKLSEGIQCGDICYNSITIIIIAFILGAILGSALLATIGYLRDKLKK